MVGRCQNLKAGHWPALKLFSSKISASLRLTPNHK